MSDTVFSQRLKELRKKAGLTQLELAQKIGVQTQSVWRWENGEREPSIEIIKNLTHILECSENDLFNPQQSERWVLQIKLADDKKEAVIDMTQNMDCVAAIEGTPYGADLHLSGSWDIFMDDDKFLDFVEQLLDSREAILQLHKNMSHVWKKRGSNK